MEFHGCCCRGMVAHFGQRPDGSPLNCTVPCLLRHGAMHSPAAGERRGASRRSLLGVAWVDDCSFYRWVKPHPSCGGLTRGCVVCRSSFSEAEELDAFWMELCKSLEVPLNLLNRKRQLYSKSVEFAASPSIADVDLGGEAGEAAGKRQGAGCCPGDVIIPMISYV